MTLQTLDTLGTKEEKWAIIDAYEEAHPGFAGRIYKMNYEENAPADLPEWDREWGKHNLDTIQGIVDRVLAETSHPSYWLPHMPVFGQYGETYKMAFIWEKGVVEAGPEELPEEIQGALDGCDVTHMTGKFIIDTFDKTRDTVNAIFHSWLAPHGIGDPEIKHDVEMGMCHLNGFEAMEGDGTLAHNRLAPQEVYLHPTDHGTIAISPDNAKFKILWDRAADAGNRTATFVGKFKSRAITLQATFVEPR